MCFVMVATYCDIAVCSEHCISSFCSPSSMFIKKVVALYHVSAYMHCITMKDDGSCTPHVAKGEKRKHLTSERTSTVYGYQVNMW